ncbi:alpha/beta hydrolase family esterase [Jiella avicenniae]|uniref:PHB depolymerase family esterase n=1 Tax=Jiella avicenniae TaxID=2907202 RepID=A0A9X1P072_9HYPH|nr:PHB depolymerase family esterase [Jiella avicenniae]MCE7027464.1 PHB depolymerase family esterase [Jiella avicenniae]
MNAFPNVDMQEVTRLTRKGRLKEAMQLLRGEPKDQTLGRETAAGRTPAEPVRSNTAKAVSRSPSSQDLLSGVLGKTLPELAGLSGLAPSATPLPMPEGARFETRSHRGPAGSRDYKLYVPARHDGSPAPLVVMLHGCTQSPDDFAAGTRMNELAEEVGFLVAYPEQTQRANAQRCWNWFEARDQRREGGEPALIAGITRDVVAEHGVDPKRVFVAGLSAGGAAAAIMGQRYPDLFAAVGVHSGLACGAARDMGSAFAAMRGGGPVEAGDTVVPTIVFHGDRDTTVAPVNGDGVIEQARAGAAATAVTSQGVSPGGIAYSRTVHREPDGRERLESWRIHGAGHAWSGGSARGTFTLPAGPDASREMLRFFLAVVG